MKRVLIVFDSSFGNTEKLAREIAAGINETGVAESVVVGIKQVEDQNFTTFDGVLFGSPIHAFRATRGIKGAVKKAAKKGLDGKLVGAFDTYQAAGHISKAAKQIEGELKKRASGVRIFSEHLSSIVTGREGPLGDAELPKAKEFGKKFVKELGE
jgi:flavodoxin